MCMYFVLAWVLFWMLSRILAPCVAEIIDGFNYIKPELVKKILKNFDNLSNYFINFEHLNIWKSNTSSTFPNYEKRIENKRVRAPDLQIQGNQKESKTNTQKHRRLNITKGIELKSIKVSICFAILFSFTILVYLIWWFLSVFYADWITYGNELSIFIKGDLVSLMSSLITMKQYSLDQTFFIASQKEHMNYQTDLFLNKVIFQSKFESLETMINSTYYDRPCKLLNETY